MTFGMPYKGRLAPQATSPHHSFISYYKGPQLPQETGSIMTSSLLKVMTQLPHHGYPGTYHPFSKISRVLIKAWVLLNKVLAAPPRTVSIDDALGNPYLLTLYQVMHAPPAI